MFEKVMHCVEWCFLLVGITVAVFCLLGLIQGLIFGEICLRVCVHKLNNPGWYWIFIVLYIVALPVMVYSIQHSWKSIASYKNN